MSSAVAEKKPYVNALESSHMYLHPDVVAKKWYIHDKDIEEILKNLDIKWKLTVKPNSFSPYGRVITYNLDTGQGLINSSMELMIKNCGAAVWHGIDSLNDYTFPISEFIARNIASYTGTPTLIATGTAASGKRMEKLGWSVPIYAPSGRWEKNMAYGMINIPKSQMAKYGYNNQYTTATEE